MSEQKKNKGGAKRFLMDIVSGFAIGIAFIIPGFSGGSIAAILGIYERLIGAIADLFKDFKKNVMTLLPVALGLVLGVISLLFPLRYALDAYPIPTVCVFVGLALGGIPSMARELKGKFKPVYILSTVIPLLLAVALSFLPIANDVNLLTGMNFFDYALLFIIGVVAASALVIPGISGSMLLLIIGYYNPIVSLITDHLLKLQNVGAAILALGSAALGIAVGFFLISIIMKKLFIKCRRGTFYAIFGFVLGSIPTVYISTVKESGQSFLSLMPNVWYWVISALLLLVGIALSLSLVIYSFKREKMENE